MFMPIQSAGGGRSTHRSAAVAGVTASLIRGGGPGGLSVHCDEGLCMCNTRLGEPCDDMAQQCRDRGSTTLDCAFSPDGHVRCYCDIPF